MKLCVFSDVHGNILFFNQFTRITQPMGIDRYIFLGDAVSYFPDGNAVISKLREIGAWCIEGNHDSMLRGEFPIPERRDEIYQLAKTIPTISEENLRFVHTWPDILELTLDGRALMFVHGAPDNRLKGYAYEDSATASFDQDGIDVLFMGHTHRSWMRQNAHTLLINVGSIGLPRDDGARPSFAIYDTQTGAAELRHFTVDIDPILANPGELHSSVLACLQRKTDE